MDLSVGLLAGPMAGTNCRDERLVAALEGRAAQIFALWLDMQGQVEMLESLHMELRSRCSSFP